jgi:hypothetical protein
MNARLLPVCLALVALFVSGCGPIEFTTKQQVQIRSEAGAPLCRVEHLVYDLGADQAFKDAQVNLGKVKVLGIKATVTSVVDGNRATRANGALKLVADSGEQLELSSWEGIAVVKDATAQIPFDASVGEKLGQVLMTAPHRVTIDSVGCADQVPAAFDLEFEFVLGAEVKLF